MLDCLKGLSSILEAFPPSARIIVWLNEYFGPVTDRDTPFEQMRIYTEHRDRIAGIVRLAKLSEEAEADFREMVAKRLTFASATARDNPALFIMQRIRLARVWAGLRPQIAEVV